MKKLFLIAATALLANSTYAQQPQGKKPHKEMHKQQNLTPEQRAQQQADRLEKILTLTPEQKQKVYAAALKKNNTIKAAKEKHKNDTDKKVLGQEIRNARKTFHDEVNAVLTPEQQAKLKAHHEKMKQEHEAKKKQMQKKPAPPKETPVDNVDELEDELED